jgi:hypothetical protein
MTPDQRNYLSVSRTNAYYDIMRTTMFSFTGLAAVIHLGPDSYSAPLVTLAVAATAYGILAGGSALDDMIALRDDMDEATANSSYGRAVKGRNLPALKLASGVLLGLVGLAEVFAILI